MSLHQEDIDLIEPERYEFNETPFYEFDVSRRDFCKMLGGGLLVLLAIPDTLRAQDTRQSGPRIPPDDTPDEIGAWIRIGQDGKVTGYTGKAEVGQQIRTSLAQGIADELRIAPENVTIIMGDTAQTPYDRGTFGSRTTPSMAPQIRRAAAAARESLIDFAAEAWKIPREKIEVRDGKVTEVGASRTATFAELTTGRTFTRQVTAETQTTPPDKWTAAGKPFANVTSHAIVTGAHQFPSDIRKKDMMFGRVVRPPQYDAKLLSAKVDAAKEIPGVVVAQNGNFLGVAAPTLVAATEAMRMIRAEWSKVEHISKKELFDYLKQNPGPDTQRGGRGPTREPGEDKHSSATAERPPTKADVELEARFTVDYIAHAPLETRAAVAEWTDGKLTVYVGTQRPFGVKAELMQAFGLGGDAVRVIMPDTGSAYGGKHTGEVAIEAARLAKAAGKTVKLVWTRQEEFTWAYFRPAGVIEVKSAASQDGKIAAWDFHNWNSGGAGIRAPYVIADEKTQFHPTKYPLRQGSYRALAATANNFAREAHIDELAQALKIDPLKFRMQNLEEERMKAVLQAVANAIGWDAREKNPGRGYGIACGAEKGGFVANAVEVEILEGASEIKLRRIITAFECGAVVNPSGVENQVEGCVIQALGGALIESVDFASGKVQNAAFASYIVPHFRDVPKMETIILDRKDLPSAGAGECPMIAIAPAIANAVFEATGKPVRALPMKLQS